VHGDLSTFGVSAPRCSRVRVYSSKSNKRRSEKRPEKESYLIIIIIVIVKVSFNFSYIPSCFKVIYITVFKKPGKIIQDLKEPLVY